MKYSSSLLFNPILTVVFGGFLLFTPLSLVFANVSLNIPQENKHEETSGRVLDRIVAIVNQDAIPESELNHQTEILLLRLRQSEMTLPPVTELRKQLLDKLILERLQLQMAKEANIEVEDSTVDDTLKDIAGRDGLTIAQMKKFLEEQGVTYDSFRTSIKNEMTISKLQQREVAPSITVSNSDVEQFLRTQNAEQKDVEYRLGHILLALPSHATEARKIEAKQQAEALVKQLKNGADFSKIAMAKSSSPQALNGGDLGYKQISELPTMFSKAAPTLTKGQVMGPIQNESGFHIIKLIDKRQISEGIEGVVLSKEEQRSKAMDVLFQRRYEERLITWLRRIRDEACVQVYE